MKGALALRPVFGYREDRIRAHVQLCWLALLLLRVIENATGDTWRTIRHELDRMHLVTWPPPTARSPNAPPLPPGIRPSWPLSSCPNPRGSSTSPSPATDAPPAPPDQGL